MKFNEHYFLEKTLINEMEILLVEENIDKVFIARLMDYLEKNITFQYGSLDNNVYNEIRKVFPSLSNDTIKKIKKKIHDIIIKGKNKCLYNIKNRIEKIDVVDDEVKTETKQQIKELSMLTKQQGVSSEEAFEYSSDADRIKISFNLLQKFLDRFGFNTNPRLINSSSEEDRASIPLIPQIHASGFDTILVKQMIEEIKEHNFVEHVEIDENKKTLNIYFLKHIIFY